jgi:hypothetical protein
MPLLPREALDRTMDFRDFKSRSKPMPKKGTFDIAALTLVGIGADGIGVTEQKVDGKTVYKVNEITVRIVFDANSWVASYVIGEWSVDDRNALRAHEQVHYMIGALSGRDYMDDLDALRQTSYPKAKDATAAIDAVKKNYTKDMIQQLQNAYDAKTKNDALDHPDEQAAWTKAIEDAKSNGTNLRATLKKAGLIA